MKRYIVLISSTPIGEEKESELISDIKAVTVLANTFGEAELKVIKEHNFIKTKTEILQITTGA